MLGSVSGGDAVIKTSGAPSAPAGEPEVDAHLASSRIVSIDALRGVVMLIMLVDHVRDFFFLHHQVGDPMDIEATRPALFMARTLSHICPTIFIFLAGLSAHLYAQRHAAGISALSRHLLLRGLFIAALEISVVNFAWTFRFPPTMVYLQVIWAIGISMIALSLLVRLPLPVIFVTGLLIVTCHQLIAVDVPTDSFWHLPWAVLHNRSVISLTESVAIRTSYPVLPWIGVIALGYALSPTFQKITGSKRELRIYVTAGISLIAGFIGLRYSNIYGETQDWRTYPALTQTMMSFFNITKYPPSLLFVMLTLGVGLLIFAFLRHREKSNERGLKWLSIQGKASMFFYILHLYVLHVLYHAALTIWGPNHGERFGFDSSGDIWLLAGITAPPLYYACRWFVGFKKGHPYRVLKYF